MDTILTFVIAAMTSGYPGFSHDTISANTVVHEHWGWAQTAICAENLETGEMTYHIKDQVTPSTWIYAGMYTKDGEWLKTENTQYIAIYGTTY